MKKKSGAKKTGDARRARAEPVSAQTDDGIDDEVAEAGSALVRLNKFLADHGVASRRKCDELIASGQVTVDGEPATELGLKIDPERQQVEIDGVVLRPSAGRRRYYLLNKPAGVVCTNEAREPRPRAIDLITDPFKGRIYTVGRLDEESKGLILLTSDGEFANRVMHPSFGVGKTYLVKVAGEIDDATLNRIRDGVHLSEGRTAGARVLVERRGRTHSLLTIQLIEGMNREIRRVFARFGFKVVELKRVRIGRLTDRGLKPGRWRELTRDEVQAFLTDGHAAQEPDAASGPPRAKPRPKKASRPGYARHLVQGGRAVERRPERKPGAGIAGGAKRGTGPGRAGGGRPATDRRGQRGAAKDPRNARGGPR